MTEVRTAAAVAVEPDALVTVLTPADAADLSRLVGEDRFALAVLGKELACHERYRWVGIRQPDGRLAATHRALFWGDYLFLKGVFVDPDVRGSDYALRLALELRRIARREGKRGIAAWVSQSSPAQVVLARRLRLTEVGPLLHLYAVPYDDASAGAEGAPVADPLARADEILLRYRTAAGERALVPDLLVRPELERCGKPAAASLPDRSHLLLSSLPCADLDQVKALLGELAPIAERLALPAVELPAPASDITLGLWLAGQKARRISWRPVRLGRSDFEQPREIRL